MLKPRDLGPGASTQTFLEAMRAGRMHLARFVLDAVDGAIVDWRSDRGRSPLMYAVLLKDPAWRLAFARLLLEHHAAVNLGDDAGRSALSLACERGYLEVTKLLVQFGADPDTVDARGWSPLMYAASEGRTSVVEWLLRAFRRFGQLRLERADRAGHTALQLAASGGHHQCVKALRSAGALLLIFPQSPSSQAGDDDDGAASAASPPLRAASERQLPLDQRSAEELRFQGEEEEAEEEEDLGGPEAKKEPSATRGRQLIRRSTAPDCQSLLSH
ncbi:PREDICTED: ankyrin repeat domain-containing protein 63 [Thamnophis sirtalis]|uniref:Ankyrin repeat domain-containing protein 63 n=1 Tax=Thamnophis sirtalis TaxID=35019 RepID=A0A6I9XL82_9SAUR|nr:PREDICTED: ankyrin repeat domain-containing protein 63 [Thamnophis sirtalis]